MVLVLGLIISLVPIMRLKDYLFKNGIELQEFYLKVKSFDFSKLSHLSWSQVWSYLKGFVNVPSSCVGFEKFEVEDSQDHFPIYDLIEEILSLV